MYLQEVAGVHETITDVDKSIADMKDEVTLKTTNEYFACMFLRTRDNKRHYDLAVDLVKKHVVRDDKYTKSLEGAQKILNNYKPAGLISRYPTNQKHSGVAFLLGDTKS